VPDCQRTAHSAHRMLVSRGGRRAGCNQCSVRRELGQPWGCVSGPKPSCSQASPSGSLGSQPSPAGRRGRAREGSIAHVALEWQTDGQRAARQQRRQRPWQGGPCIHASMTLRRIRRPARKSFQKAWALRRLLASLASSGDRCPPARLPLFVSSSPITQRPLLSSTTLSRIPIPDLCPWCPRALPPPSRLSRARCCSECSPYCECAHATLTPSTASPCVCDQTRYHAPHQTTPHHDARLAP
jgi:hypothetical protein